MVHIPNIERELLLPGEIVAAAHLGQASDAREHFVSAPLLRRVTVKILHQQGARPNKAKVAFEHVDQLGQFIEAGAAQQHPEWREALLVRQQLARCVARRSHASKLVDYEWLVVATRTLLPEKHRRAELKAHQQSHSSYYGGKQNQHRDSDGQVKEAFSRLVVLSPALAQSQVLVDLMELDRHKSILSG